MPRFELIIRLVAMIALLLASCPAAAVSANPGQRLASPIKEPTVPLAAAVLPAAVPTKKTASLPVPAFATTVPVSATEIITPTAAIFLPLISKLTTYPPVDVPTSTLTIGKTAPTTATMGAPITYTLRITNSGPAPAANLVITDAVPAGATYVSGGTAVSDGVVSWTLPALAGGAVAQASFVVTAATTITNSDYRVSASGGISATGAAPVVTVVLRPPEANFSAGPQTGPIPLTVTFTNNSSEATSFRWSFGDGITSTLISPTHTYTQTGVYTVTLNALGQAGSTTATTVITATDAAINGLSVTSDSPTVINQATTLTATTVAGRPAIYAWDFGDGSQAAGQERVVTHTYPAIGSYMAVVTASNSVSLVTATTSVSITGTVGLAIGKNAPISVRAGDPITYTLTVSNSGALTATNLLITDVLPVEANYVSGGTPAGNIVSWTVAALAPGSSTSLQLIVTATETITNSEYQVTGDGGAAAAGQEAIVTMVYPPVAVDFAADPLSGTVPLTVTFANSSTNAILYLWEFGDTLTSTEVSPAHSYTQAGIYSVTLTAVGLSGSETLTRPNYLTLYEPVVAEFSAAPLTGTVPLTVTFANSSTGASGYVWNFGDSITGTTISPTHPYTQAGVYTVTLTANGPGGSDTLTQTNYIVAAAPIVAGFSASPLTGPAPFTVAFTNTSTNAIHYLWDFGDGITDTLINPTHAYTQAGVYTVTLTASDGAFTNFLTQTNFVTVTNPLIRAWRQITPTLPAPQISDEHSMAYDSGRARVVLYGGNAGGWPYEDTTWEFDGTGWISITTTSRPEARYGAGLAYDPLRQVTVLFGGSDETDTALNQTWEYTHTDWVQVFPTTSPLSRTYHSLAANPASGALYLFGGNKGETHLNDLWVYQNGDWLEIQGSGIRPASRTLAALAYDPDNNRLLLFGGRSAAGTLLADLWSFDLTAETWQELADEGGGGPPARMAHSLTYDTAAGNAVLAGGVTGEGDVLLNDTWHYHHQTGWVEAATTTGLPELAYHQAVYDGQTLILFTRGQVWKYE